MKSLISLSFLFFAINAYALTELGNCDIGKNVVPNVVCYGQASLKQTTVNGDVKIAGPLVAKQSSMNTLTTVGAVDMEDCTVKGIADISGYLHARGCAFEKNLVVKASSIRLRHTTIKGSINITSKRKPSLTLECGTTVVGSVTFSGGRGTVQMSEDSVVTGKINNATVEKINMNCKS